MKIRSFKNIPFRQAVIALLCLFVASICMVPMPVRAEEPEGKVVRVGWFDSSFCYWDQFGRRCGIAYEYQHKISAYTGWTYEYVEDSWPNLFQMLKDGEIDLLSDVSYKPERAEDMLFPDLPMGSESYYIYIDAENTALSASDLSTYNGTRIGVNAGSIQEGFLSDWREKNGIDFEIVPLVEDEDESLEQVVRGELDGYASIYTFSSEQKVSPSVRIGSSEYYYVVNKNRPDLLAELNAALASIQDEDPLFNQRLNEERLHNSRTNAYLSQAQEAWLANHGTIRIGYREDFLPFCQMDKETGELTGALKDYLAHAANNLRSSEIVFETVPYATTEEAMKAMVVGEVDCVFPVYLSSYDSEQIGVRLTNPPMTTEMNAVMRVSDIKELSKESTISIAISEGDPNLQTFIMGQYPAATIKTFASTDECFDAVAAGQADCTLISNYRLPSVEEAIAKRRLFSVPSGEVMPLSFAMQEGSRDLYFLLNKTVVMTKDEDMATSLASYMRTEQRVSLIQFLKENMLGVIIFLTVLFSVIVFLLLQKLKVERKANEQQKLMEESLLRELQQKEQLQSAMEMAYRDPLTGVKSKHAYNEAEKRMDQRIAEGLVNGFSVVVFDLNDLKQINDSRGHEVGDEYIKDACKLICTCFKHSPVFRIGGDEFTAILEGEDYANQDELLAKFERQVLENLDRDRSVVAFGCSRFNPQQDRKIRTVFERADAMMYKEKTLLKNMGAGDRKDSDEQEAHVFGTEDISAINVRRSILIADDIESNREILGDLLSEDYQIIYAGDGVETMEILRAKKDEIALVILDLYMPKMSGREVMTQMQVDEELMFIPVIFISVDLNAELDCLKIGAMDFLPKPYPDIEVIKQRISKCIELSENRDLIRRTQKDKLTGLFNFDYFLRYVNRYDVHFKETAFDAIVLNVNNFYEVNEQYGRQFGDVALRSIGIGIGNLARKIRGIGCRKEGDTFLLYVPHQEEYEELLQKFVDDLFVQEETASRIKLRFGIYQYAQQEPDIEERFIRAKKAADQIEHDPEKWIAFYEFAEN